MIERIVSKIWDMRMLIGIVVAILLGLFFFQKILSGVEELGTKIKKVNSEIRK